MSSELHAPADTADADRAVRYRCPFCESDYENEVLARVHITRATDDRHKNHDGFMPETKVALVDEDGCTVKTISRRPEELSPNDIDLEAFPSEYSERKRRVLLVAAYKPSADYTELHERTTAVLREHDQDPVSYETVRRWVRDFYLPHQESSSVETEDEPESESLGSLTPKQQAVVIARLEDPEASKTELAERAGCSVAYPSSVFDRASHIIDRLSARLSSGDSLEAILTDELTSEDIETVTSDELLGDEFFPPQFGEKAKAQGETPRVRDGPANGSNSKILSASPPAQPVSGQNDTEEAEELGDVDTSEVGENGDAGSHTHPDERTEPAPNDGQADSNDDSDAHAATDHSSTAPTEGDAVPREDVEALRDRIRFIRRVTAKEVSDSAGDVDHRARTQHALAKEIENQLDSLLAG